MAKDIESRIGPFAQALETALGANLVSLVLYGSHARAPDGHAGRDINLLLVVRDASVAALAPAAQAIGRWSRDGETPPLIFSQDEWQASADVFPLEIEDMRDAHRVLRGPDPLATVTTRRENLRHQVEREIRGKLLHLRTEYATAAEDGKALARLLQNSLSTFLVFFRATLRLKAEPAPADPRSLVRETARVAGFAPEPFEWALQARGGSAVLQPFDRVAAQYVDAIEQLARLVDNL